MQVDGGVDQVCIVPVALRDWAGEPLVVGLPREAQHPAGDRDRHPERPLGLGQVGDQGEHHFGLMSRDR